MTQIRIVVSFRDGVLDPAAHAVEQSLHALGFDSLEDLKLSKQIDLTLAESDPDKACELVEQMCKRLLVNQVMETYTIKVQMRASVHTS